MRTRNMISRGKSAQILVGSFLLTGLTCFFSPVTQAEKPFLRAEQARNARQTRAIHRQGLPTRDFSVRVNIGPVEKRSVATSRPVAKRSLVSNTNVATRTITSTTSQVRPRGCRLLRRRRPIVRTTEQTVTTIQPVVTNRPVISNQSVVTNRPVISSQPVTSNQPGLSISRTGSRLRVSLTTEANETLNILLPNGLRRQR